MEIRCPRCGDTTRLRIRSRDDCKFHVCVNWPECKGMVEYDEDWDGDLGKKKPIGTHGRVRQPHYDEEATAAVDLRGVVGKELKWGPTCLAAFVIVMLQFVASLIILATAPNISEKTSLVIYAVIAVVSYIVGGFLVGVMVREKGAWHGMLAGFIAWGTSLLLPFLLAGRYFVWTYFESGTDFVIGSLVGLLLEMGFVALGGFSGNKLSQHWSL